MCRNQEFLQLCHIIVPQETRTSRVPFVLCEPSETSEPGDRSNKSDPEWIGAESKKTINW